MKEQTEEKMINNRIIEAARRYAGLFEIKKLKLELRRLDYENCETQNIC